MRTEAILKFVKELKQTWQTKDPYKIAEIYGIKVITRNLNVGAYKAQTIKMQNYPSIISINGLYSERARAVLCAHELGHALLHEELVNHFDTTSKNMNTDVEYEANLFAVALLADESKLCMPLHKLNSVALKAIMDYNID